MPSPKSGTQRSPAWREQFRGQFAKTKMCRFHLAGMCRFEKDCPFAHEQEELNTPPDLRKTMLCDAWKRGVCGKAAEDCPFAHGDEELCITTAFAENPLSKRVRELAKAQRAEEPNPQDADQLCLDAIEATPNPAPPAPLPLAQGNKPGRRQRHREREESFRAAANAQECEDSSPMCTTPTFTCTAERFPWTQASPFYLIGPFFNNASPEKVAEMLRMAMPDHYED